MPLAGVGCGIARDALDAVAESRGGLPFDASSLTEDYEMGLRIAVLGGKTIFARIAEYPGGPLVAVRAYFPATLAAAVRQKARWMTGIALVGWDRIGWGRALDWRDHWMRMRDRRAPLAVLALAVGYVALFTWVGAQLTHALTGTPSPPLLGPMAWLLTLNAALLGWRTAMRMVFTGLAHGPVEALWSLPRFVVSNLVALFSARRAVSRYVAMLRGAAPIWDKTAHRFPPLPLDHV